jgi:Tol biopolymer transport system component
MARRLILIGIALALSSGAVASRASDRSAPQTSCDPTKQGCFQLQSTIAFTSTRDNPTGNPLLAAEIYLMGTTAAGEPDPTNTLRLTDNAYGDGFPTLSPDGKKIVFDSNRCLFAVDGCPAAPQFDTAGNPITAEALNTSELFVMSTDGSEQSRLTRGSSATWSPDGKEIAFHASASYYASGGLVTGLPIRTDPGSATSDSDIFVANVDDLLAGTEQPRNITNTTDQIEDDPDWSSVPTTAPKGQSIVFTSHPTTDNTQDSIHAQLYLMNPDGSDRLQLTTGDFEKRAPAWSPDGSRIVYSCRVGPPNPRTGIKSFRICVINADGSGQQQLTNETDSISDLTASWSPDGQQILFHRLVPPGLQQLFVINADATPPSCSRPLVFLPVPACQLTSAPGINNLAHWGELRVRAGS